MNEEPLLQVEHVTKTFPVRTGMLSGGRGRLTAVDDVSFDLRRGETLGLVGESGCGKSTVARLALRLEAPDAGTIRFKGQDIFSVSGKRKKAFRRCVQIVFQDPFSSLNPRRRVESIVGEPLLIHRIVPRSRIKERVGELLERVGLQPENSSRFPHEFSSGQRQRIGLARALSLEPEIIVADEPVSALDVSIQAQTINLLMDLQEQMHLTYLFISHDLSVVRYVSTTVAVMYLGKIVEIAPKDALYNEPIHPYTEALLSSAPLPDPFRSGSRILLKGDVPSPLDPVRGCIFSGRCPIVDKTICLSSAPPLEEKKPGHRAACFLR